MKEPLKVQYSTDSKTVQCIWYRQYTQYSTVQYSSVQYSTVQYSTVQYSTYDNLTFNICVCICINLICLYFPFCICDIFVCKFLCTYHSYNEPC